MSRIVLTDGDEAMRAVLEAYLERLGHDVEVVESGAEIMDALRRVEETASQTVVVCEAHLPDCRGLELLRVTRSSFPQTRVVLMTTFGDAVIARRARELGATAVLEKPFDLGELAQILCDDSTQVASS